MVTLASRIRGAALAALRHLKGWTGLQLAQAVGTSKGMISHYESGHKELSLERFLEYGLAMGYTLRRLEAARFGLGRLRRLEGDGPSLLGPPRTRLSLRPSRAGFGLK